MPPIEKPSIGLARWVEFTPFCSWLAPRSRNPRRCGGPSSGCPPVSVANCSTDLRPLAIPTTTALWMPHSSTSAASSHYRDQSDRHIQTLKTTALVIRTRVPPLISTVRHTGFKIHRWAVGWCYAILMKSRVSTATKATTTNLCGTPSVQRMPGH